MVQKNKTFLKFIKICLLYIYFAVNSNDDVVDEE